MGIAPALLLALCLAGCAKKKPPQAPAAPATEAAPASDDMKSSDAPAEGDEDAKDTRSSDPCEGGE